MFFSILPVEGRHPGGAVWQRQERCACGFGSNRPDSRDASDPALWALRPVRWEPAGPPVDGIEPGGKRRPEVVRQGLTNTVVERRKARVPDRKGTQTRLASVSGRVQRLE